MGVEERNGMGEEKEWGGMEGGGMGGGGGREGVGWEGGVEDRKGSVVGEGRERWKWSGGREGEGWERRGGVREGDG